MALTKSLHDLRDLAAERAEELEEAAANAGTAVAQRFNQAAHGAAVAAERVRETAGTVSRRTARGVHEVQDTISHHPLTAAFVAIGVGFIVAALTLRRR